MSCQTDQIFTNIIRSYRIFNITSNQINPNIFNTTPQKQNTLKAIWRMQHLRCCWQQMHIDVQMKLENRMVVQQGWQCNKWYRWSFQCPDIDELKRHEKVNAKIREAHNYEHWTMMHYRSNYANKSREIIRFKEPTQTNDQTLRLNPESDNQIQKPNQETEDQIHR